MSEQRDLSPETVFSMVGNDRRIAIIEALSEADGQPLSFTELWDSVGIRDSGQFNYHLNKLVGTFVYQNSEEKYALSFAGHRIVGAIHSGELTRNTESKQLQLDSSCPFCATHLEADYVTERVTIECPECENVHSSFGFPPGGLSNRSPEELTQAFDSWVTNVTALFAGGVCVNCTGQTSGRLRDDLEDERYATQPVGVSFVCEQCTDSVTISVSFYCALQPAVIAFYYANGIDFAETGSWAIEHVTDECIDVLCTDPLCIRTTFDLGGNQLTVTLEEDLTMSVSK